MSDPDPDYDAMFLATQQDRLASLRRDALDRPEHGKYIDQLIDEPGNPQMPPPSDVSADVVHALGQDVDWVSTTAPDGFSALYPHAYQDRRLQERVDGEGKSE